MDTFEVLGARTFVPYLFLPIVTVAFILCFIRAYTTWKYHRSVRLLTATATSGREAVEAPQIPYTIPFLGNALSFLATDPGAFWDSLFTWHPRSTGVSTLLLGGKSTHFVFSPPAVQALFKEKRANRVDHERELFSKVFLMPQDQINNAEVSKHFEHEMNAQYLTKFESVNELTAGFTQVLADVFKQDVENVDRLGDIALYEWLRDRMFTASTTALMGDKLLQMYPDFCNDFYKFDSSFVAFLFGLPSFMMGDAVEVRQRIFDRLGEWSVEMHRLSGGTPIDPESVAWEPLMGSRLNRARQINYKTRKLNKSTGTALDLGIVFGLSSNVIPATGWMLMHILNPKGDSTLLPRVLAELREAEKENGTFDIPTLVSQPLLQSIWMETLRLYTDVLVTRTLTEDIILPIDEDGKRRVKLYKGDNAYAPSWPSSRDDAAWSDLGGAPADIFYAERFLAKNPATGRFEFFAKGTAGKIIAFGGGKTICPGRIFAKQEAFGALAMTLLTFDFDVKGYVDGKGKPTEQFPGFAKAYPGSGALAPGGDFKVTVRRRK